MTEGEDGTCQPEWMKDAPAWVRERRAMNEAEWLAEPSFVYALGFFEDQKYKYSRRLRLFAWPLLPPGLGVVAIGGGQEVCGVVRSVRGRGDNREELLAAHDSSGFDTLDAQERRIADAATQLSHGPGTRSWWRGS